jgi:hypothetical protein
LKQVVYARCIYLSRSGGRRRWWWWGRWRGIIEYCVLRRKVIFREITNILRICRSLSIVLEVRESMD